MTKARENTITVTAEMQEKVKGFMSKLSSSSAREIKEITAKRHELRSGADYVNEVLKGFRGKRVMNKPEIYPTLATVAIEYIDAHIRELEDIREEARGALRA